MVRRRAATSNFATKIGSHTFGGTGFTAHLKSGGGLERARYIANHADPCTQLYDCRRDPVALDEVAKIQL